jgi:hypothetical protein
LARHPSLRILGNSRAEFLRLIAMNTTLRQIVDRISSLELPDTWVAGGCLFQTVWNILAGEDPTRAIKDYDVFYFDPQDCTVESEERANLRAAALFSDLNCNVDVRNQARVHLWYAQEFGVEGYPRLGKSTDGIDNFLAVCCMVGIRKSRDGSIDLYAPLGVDDVLSMTMRPNPWFRRAPRDSYERKADRWRALWPELAVKPFSETSPGTAPGAE